jgi:phenylacetate-CoA ligase
VEVQAAFLRRVQPAYIFVNPSNLRLLLGHLRDHPVDLPGLRSMWTLSEAVDDSLRALCREVLGVRIVHNYTAAETGWMALQCPAHPHFHVQSELFIVEVVDEANRQVAPGETGRVLVTPLHNFAMPLLRYEIGDTAEWGPPCPCGRGLPVLTRIGGRILDLLTLPDGRVRRTDFSHYRLSQIRAVREYQVIQRSRTRIEILLVTARRLTPAETAEVESILATEFTEGFEFAITEVASIPRTEAGKLRPFLSEVLPRG